MIHREERDPVTILSIENGKANALDPVVLGSLREALIDLEDRTGAVVLTGSGEMFSAGLDLKRLAEDGSDYVLELVERLDQLLESLVRSPLPTVAAINGHAIAGGYVLASACDLRLLARGPVRIGLTEMALGVPFPPLAMEVVRSAVGDRVARRAILSARLFGDEEARDLGLIDELVQSGALLDRAVSLAAELAQIPRRTYDLTKRQLWAPSEATLRDLGDDFVDRVRQEWLAPETTRRIRRFVAERIG